MCPPNRGKFRVPIVTDTAAEMEKVYRTKLMALSGEERFLRGARMFEAAREMVVSSLALDTGTLK